MAIWASFKSAISEVFTFVKTVVDTFRMAWQENFFGIQQIVQTAWQVIKNITTTYLGGVMDIIKGIIDIIGGIFRAFTAFIK